uniref:Uncharacterized protein n=1 Tax=Brugia timori TaxID=42155 RepID=A0A0R3R9L1_9BILA
MMWLFHMDRVLEFRPHHRVNELMLPFGQSSFYCNYSIASDLRPSDPENHASTDVTQPVCAERYSEVNAPFHALVKPVLRHKHTLVDPVAKYLSEDLTHKLGIQILLHYQNQ